MSKHSSQGAGEGQVVFIQYSSSDLGSFEFSLNPTLLQSGVEISSMIALIHLVRAISCLIKTIQGES
ncbi:MAG: hypothetical protein AAFY20_15125 [Cyanobacteria bacterium J06639_14]